MPTYNRNKDGYYKASIVTEYSPDGKQKRVTVRSKNLSEFKEKLKSAQNLNDHGYDFDNKNITVAEWAGKWYDTYKKHKVSHGTSTSYEIDLRRHILPVIGGYKLTDVRPDMLQDLLNKFEGHSTSHADKIKLTLKQLFRKAYHDGLILRDVSDCLELPDTVEGERRALTAEEENAVVKVAKTHRAGLWAMVMLRADLRPEETVPLMWSDIDFTPGNETITVRRAVEWLNNRPSLKKPKKKPKKKEKKKGKEAERTIPIAPDLLKMLQAVPRKGLYVFTPKQSNGMLTRTNLDRLWKSFRREVDIEMGATVYRNKIIKNAFDIAITPYYLRHTCCTRWFENGMDLKSAQYLMGHADIATTTKIYIHVMPTNIRNASDVISGTNGIASLQNRR